MTRSSLIVAALVVATLAGCSPEEEAPPPVRPVLSVVVKPIDEGKITFAGTIQPRYQTDRGFQVLGRIIAYNVDIGDVVKRGDVLAQLDPTPFALDVRAKEGELARARSELKNSTLAAARTERLVGQEVGTQADLDADRQVRDADAASVSQAEANLTKSKEQLGYATLVADEDGVVTTKDADVGQTVSAGSKVMTVARVDVREAVVDVPESVADSLATDAPLNIRLQVDPTVEVGGKVREIAPQADASTRTRRIRVTLDRIVEAFRLGTTINATALAATGDRFLEVPASAILEGDRGTRVWVVDEETKTVATVPVAIGDRNDRFVRLTGGLEEGTRVVVAGIRSLKEGQPVKTDEETIE